MYDFQIIGAGLTGTIIARILSDNGKKVVVFDRRDVVGGNIHDFLHPSGIRVNTYGPHYFRTNSNKIWEFVHKYAAWYYWAAKVMTRVNTGLEHWPVTKEYINREIGEWEPQKREGSPKNFEDACLRMMPLKIYEEFVKPYTELQWGRKCRDLDASLARRFEVRENADRRLKEDIYQALPIGGYKNFIRNLLKGIDINLQTDWKPEGNDFGRIIYTGSIDEFFNYKFGRLKYRYQKRVHEYFQEADFIQPVVQLNNSGPSNAIRQIEWKHMVAREKLKHCVGTVITWEYPKDAEEVDQREYPIPDKNSSIYDIYKTHAQKETPNVLFCGRLGEYRYLDMDQAIGRAMMHADRILNNRSKDYD